MTKKTPTLRSLRALGEPMKKHFVTFCSPGTFLAEQTEKPIESWDPVTATDLCRGIVERYGGRPYGFYFTTRERKANELDSKEVKRSGMYYLGGRLLDVKAVKREIPNSSILVSNMECNGWKQVIVNDNSWRWTQPFKNGDVLLAGDFRFAALTALPDKLKKGKR